MPILPTAFILQVHKNPDQVNKFVHQLYAGDEADIYIHIDKRNFEQMNSRVLTNTRVKVLKESLDCEWGDISQVNVTLMLIREVLASKKEYDFVCLRSGQDLLVNPGFKDYLLENQDKIFMRNKKLDKKDTGFMKITWPKFARKRYTSNHPFRVMRRILLFFYRQGINILPNRNKWGMEEEFYKGSQWFAIPFEVAKYMIEFLDENEWFYQYFVNSLVPDESFFHTLIMNSPYRNNVVNDNLYFMKWGETLSERNSPQDLSMEDVGLIEKSGMYFARKFDMDKDQDVINYFAKQVRFQSANSLLAEKM